MKFWQFQRKSMNFKWNFFKYNKKNFTNSNAKILNFILNFAEFKEKKLNYESQNFKWSLSIPARKVSILKWNFANSKERVSISNEVLSLQTKRFQIEMKCCHFNRKNLDFGWRFVNANENNYYIFRSWYICL